MAAAAALASIAPVASAALLDDVVPPPWQRFAPFTTFQEWDFNDPGQIAPDGGAIGNFFNEGKPNDTPIVTPGDGVFWDDGEYGGTGGPNSYLEFFVPNWIDQEPLKLIWIQINGAWLPGAAPPSVESVFGQKGTLPPFIGEPLGSQEDFPGFHRTELWSLQPNPDFEFIRIFIPEGAFVTQVVIDTISFPTPGALAAFGLAGLAAARRRR
jgi:hypothetical protein